MFPGCTGICRRGGDGPYEGVARFYAPDVRVQEFPNRIAPQGRIRRGGKLQAAYELGKQILKSPSYGVQRIVECGDGVAVELEWRGVLAVAVGPLAAGSEMKAFVAMFLKVRDEKIVEQRNYDGYAAEEKWVVSSTMERSAT